MFKSYCFKRTYLIPVAKLSFLEVVSKFLDALCVRLRKKSTDFQVVINCGSEREREPTPFST